jgi:hypothetical protein
MREQLVTQNVFLTSIYAGCVTSDGASFLAWDAEGRRVGRFVSESEAATVLREKMIGSDNDCCG